MPQSNKRLIDLSKAAAKNLDYIYKGLTRVKIDILDGPVKTPAERPNDLQIETIPFIKAILFEGNLQLISC